MDGLEIRAALDRHWSASDASDLEGEHQIYREDAVLEYPQSGERIRGRRKIQASRDAQPHRKRFRVRRIIGTGDLYRICPNRAAVSHREHHGVSRWESGPRDPVFW